MSEAFDCAGKQKSEPSKRNTEMPITPHVLSPAQSKASYVRCVDLIFFVPLPPFKNTIKPVKVQS